MRAAGRGGRKGPCEWEGTEQAPAAAAPPPPGRAWRRWGAGGGEECGAGSVCVTGGGEGARGPGDLRSGGGPETRSRSPGAGGAPSRGTSQRWNPRNAGLRELSLPAREKRRSFHRQLCTGTFFFFKDEGVRGRGRGRSESPGVRRRGSGKVNATRTNSRGEAHLGWHRPQGRELADCCSPARTIAQCRGHLELTSCRRLTGEDGPRES